MCSLHDICTNCILVFRSLDDLYGFSNKSAVVLQKMPVFSVSQKKTEPHQTTGYTPVQLLLAPDILRSHGQMHSIAISWIREDNLLLIPSLNHNGNKTRIHLDCYIEIQGISCLGNWNISALLMFFSFFLLLHVNFVVKKL